MESALALNPALRENPPALSVAVEAARAAASQAEAEALSAAESRFNFLSTPGAQTSAPPTVAEQQEQVRTETFDASMATARAENPALDAQPATLEAARQNATEAADQNAAMATATQTQSVAPEAQATTSQLSEPVAAAAAVVAKENPAFSQQLSEAVSTQAVAYSVDPAAVAMSVTMMETLPPEMLEGLAASPSAHPVDKAAIAALTGYTGSPVPEIKETPAQKTEPVGETPAPIDLIESPPYPDVSTPAGQPVNDQPFLDKMDALVAANQLQLQTNKTHRIAQRQDGDWDVFEESDNGNTGSVSHQNPFCTGVCRQKTRLYHWTCTYKTPICGAWKSPF
jgi:hypothetical protein